MQSGLAPLGFFQGSRPLRSGSRSHALEVTPEQSQSSIQLFIRRLGLMLRSSTRTGISPRSFSKTARWFAMACSTTITGSWTCLKTCQTQRRRSSARRPSETCGAGRTTSCVARMLLMDLQLGWRPNSSAVKSFLLESPNICGGTRTKKARLRWIRSRASCDQKLGPGSGT